MAFEYPATPEGNTAVNLVLDSYKTTDDYLGLIRAGTFHGENEPLQSSIKAEIAPIVKSAEQFQLDELALAAAGVDGGMLPAISRNLLQPMKEPHWVSAPSSTLAGREGPAIARPLSLGIGI